MPRKSNAIKKFIWTAKSSDGAFEDKSEKIFNKQSEAYNDMRNAALEKMKWNTEFDEDLKECKFVNYSVVFAQDKIVHKSYSGVYVYEIKEVGRVMNTTNGHDAELVCAINTAWEDNAYHNAMLIILFAMITLYEDEYKEKVSALIPTSYDVISDDIASEVLMQICDDHDLQTILSFIGYEE